jgi:hypothetical protein
VALRDIEDADEPNDYVWARSLELYVDADSAGWDATGGLPRMVAKPYPGELLDFRFYLRAVDEQAPTRFPAFRRAKKPLTRGEARKIASAKREDRLVGIDPGRDRWQWEYEQDVAAFQSWRAKLPMTRNAKVGHITAYLRADVHIAAGLVCPLPEM